MRVAMLAVKSWNQKEVEWRQVTEPGRTKHEISKKTLEEISQ